jgi:hypothetical protein
MDSNFQKPKEGKKVFKGKETEKEREKESILN